MKTKEQILEWLDKQPWKNEFYEEFFKNGNATILWGEDFILMALDYKKGVNMESWEERNKCFNDWYNSDDKPMSWEEYCEQNPICEDAYVIDANGIFPLRMKAYRSSISDMTVMSKELCEASVAYMKLIQLRNAWVKECNCMAEMAYKITTVDGVIQTWAFLRNTNGLSFQTRDMAAEFVSTFRDLLEIAKPLL